MRTDSQINLGSTFKRHSVGYDAPGKIKMFLQLQTKLNFC
jgi:hypothetical protein